MPEAEVLDGGMGPNPTPELTAVVIVPDSAFVQTGDSFAFIAVGRMSDGSTTDVTITWSATAGSVSSTGVYRAPGSPGKHRVIAKHPNRGFSDTSIVAVDSIIQLPPPGPVLTGVAISPESAQLQAGESVTFTAAGRLSDGSTSSVTVQWSATGGSVSTGGVYQAPATAGSYRVIASTLDWQFADTATVTVTAPPTPSPGTRDPLKWPFAATSIWNMPIGSGAVYVRAGPNGVGNMPGHLPAYPGFPDGYQRVPDFEPERIVLRPTAPMTDIRYSSAGWSGASRCTATGASTYYPTGLMAQVPIPTDYLVPSSNMNEVAVFLMPDRRTLVQVLPLARCTAGGYATAQHESVPRQDLYGDGITGSHGGSNLSAIGGSLRVGELRPGQQGPRHALKLNLFAKYLFFNCAVAADCKRWPATAADGYWAEYGDLTANTNRAMRMGVLLAIPASTSLSTLNLETEPGRQLAWTLQNYGAYVVDDAADVNYALSVEEGADGSFRAQFQADYGFSFRQVIRDNTPWSRDWMKLMEALWVVDNNGPTSIGGGGTPRQPLAPPFQ
jgi:hypothetical protein